MRYRLSILVIAKNEEKQIANCLETLNFGDEIVVILDSCDDNTKKLQKNIQKLYILAHGKMKAREEIMVFQNANLNGY